jgi:hypothetical protein
MRQPDGDSSPTIHLARIGGSVLLFGNLAQANETI